MAVVIGPNSGRVYSCEVLQAFKIGGSGYHAMPSIEPSEECKSDVVIKLIFWGHLCKLFFGGLPDLAECLLE